MMFICMKLATMPGRSVRAHFGKYQEIDPSWNPRDI